MTHPLTDEIIGQIQTRHGGPRYGCYPDFRAAADWQLEQCVEELDCLLSVFGSTGVIKEEAVPTIVELFKSNMRPQEDNS